MPNTKDGRSVSVVGTCLRTITQIVDIPATTDYAANDVLSQSASAGSAWTFADVVPENGGSGTIIGAICLLQTTNITPTFTLYLYKATPTSQLNDNAANTAVIWADRENYIGKIDFPSVESLGAAAADGEVDLGSGKLPKPFLCAESDNDLYGILVTREAITGEVANHDVFISLLIRQD